MVQPVRINLSQVQLALKQSSIPANRLTALPSYSPSVRVQGKFYVIEGAKPIVGETGSADAGAQVRRLLAEAKKRTYAQLVEQFRQIYTNEARALRHRKLLSYDPIQQKIYAQVMNDISRRYQIYSNQRGPLLASLSVLVGFPDRHPDGSKKLKGVFVQAPYYLPRANALRKKIHDLDQSFTAEFQGQMASLKHAQGVAYQALLNEISEEIGNINQRATDAANTETQQSANELGPLISASPPETLPAVKSHTIEVPTQVVSQPNLSTKPIHPFVSIGSLQAYLQIWEGINGYRLSKNPLVPNRTNQFIQWIKQNYPETFTSH